MKKAIKVEIHFLCKLCGARYMEIHAPNKLGHYLTKVLTRTHEHADGTEGICELLGYKYIYEEYIP